MTSEEQLRQFLEKNRSLQMILDRADDLGLKDWYLGAGGISQTVWNLQHGFDPEHGIVDYDLVYYDSTDLSPETEAALNEKGRELFKSVPVLVEIVNEARVHLWYEKDFGRPIDQYRSVEDAISTWPTTATSVGVRKVGNDLKIYAPFGLDDLLNMVVRANKAKITEDIYRNKAERWAKTWPKLKVIPWN